MKLKIIVSLVIMAAAILSLVGGAQQQKNVIVCFGLSCYNVSDFQVRDSDNDGQLEIWQNGEQLDPEDLPSGLNPTTCEETQTVVPAFTDGPEEAFINPEYQGTYDLCDGDDMAAFSAELPGTFVSAFVEFVGGYTTGEAALLGNAGDDVLFDNSFLPLMALYGGEGNDIVSTAGDALIVGNEGNDWLLGSGGPFPGGNGTQLTGNDCLGGAAGPTGQDPDGPFFYDCEAVLVVKYAPDGGEPDQDIFLGASGWDSFQTEEGDGNDIVIFNRGDVPAGKFELWECYDDDIIITNGITTSGTIAQLPSNGSGVLWLVDPQTGGVYIIVVGGKVLGADTNGNGLPDEDTSPPANPTGTCTILNY